MFSYGVNFFLIPLLLSLTIYLHFIICAVMNPCFNKLAKLIIFLGEMSGGESQRVNQLCQLFRDYFLFNFKKFFLC